MLFFILLLYCLRVNSNDSSNVDLMSHMKWSLLDHDICGNPNTDRIIGGKNANIGAYPWIARIGYITSKSNPINVKNLIYGCGGSLINKYYVVTAAHCVVNLPYWVKVFGVRLGEHNTLTDPDCEKEFCAEPVQDFQVMSVIVHKDYNSPKYKNDIAIVRLDKPAVYNEFVTPICMPHGKLLEKNYVGEMAVVAGWGIENIDTSSRSTLLQTITLPIQDTKLCSNLFNKLANINDQQICVGGIAGEDSCNGDSGGPLMKVETIDELPKYYLIGVVSFGVQRCGKTATPGVYTRMSSYVDWVLNNIDS